MSRQRIALLFVILCLSTEPAFARDCLREIRKSVGYRIDDATAVRSASTDDDGRHRIELTNGRTFRILELAFQPYVGSGIVILVRERKGHASHRLILDDGSIVSAELLKSGGQ